MVTVSTTDLVSLTFLDKLHITYEQRRSKLNEEVYYERLSLAQKVAAAELRQFGFELKFIRGELFESMAIFSCGSLNATVDYSGEIDSLSPINLRK